MYWNFAEKSEKSAETRVPEGQRGSGVLGIDLVLQNRATIDRMNISKADAIAHLAKWFDSGAQVRATFRTISGNSVVVGRIKELSAAAIKVTGSGCEMMLYFRTTSEYDYKDNRQPESEDSKSRGSKYPTVIDVKFGNGDHLDVLECFED